MCGHWLNEDILRCRLFCCRHGGSSCHHYFFRLDVVPHNMKYYLVPIRVESVLLSSMINFFCVRTSLIFILIVVFVGLERGWNAPVL